MPHIPRGRHVGFTSDGTPIIRELPSPICIDFWADEVNPFGTRHISFTEAGLPITAAAAHCCDSVDTCPRVEQAGTSTVLPDGLPVNMILRISDVQNCRSVDGNIVNLQYCDPNGPTPNPPCDTIPDCIAGSTISGCATCDDAVKGKWFGGTTFRGGSLNFELCYTIVHPGLFDELQWHLRWSGCGSDPDWDAGCTDKITECYDPIITNFDQFNLPRCCDCGPDGTSVDTATINVRLEGACKPVVHARHINFMADGTPIVTHDNCTATLDDGCCQPTCPLVAAVTGSGDCSCLTDTVDMPYLGSVVWSGSGGACGGGGITEAQYTLTCTANDDGTNTLHLEVVCGATNTGSADVIVRCDDMDDLDVTFVVAMTDPSVVPCDEQNCGWIWNPMSVVWELVQDDCLPDCDDCPNSPANPPPDPTLYEVTPWTEPCTGSISPACCIGSISVRIMRA